MAVVRKDAVRLYTPAAKTDETLAIWRQATTEQRDRRRTPMGKVLELSEETYAQLADLAQRQRRPVDEMLRVCLTAYEEALYTRAHQQMLADGVLVTMPAPPWLPGERDDEDEEPMEIPGKPLSEIILEERR